MRTRQEFKPNLKKDIARGYLDRQLTPEQIEARGIKMNNVYRWMHEFFPGEKRVDKASAGKATAAPTSAPEPAKSAPLAILSLSKKQIRPGDNGRYAQSIRDACVQAFPHISVPDLADKTGINSQTLYNWKEAAAKKPNGNGHALEPKKNGSAKNGNGGGALVVANPKPSTAVSTRKAELILGESSLDGELDAIDKQEGLANIVKAAKELKTAFKRGDIEDLDRIDLRLLLGYAQVMGTPLRSRK